MGFLYELRFSSQDILSSGYGESVTVCFDENWVWDTHVMKVDVHHQYINNGGMNPRRTEFVQETHLYFLMFPLKQ